MNVVDYADLYAERAHRDQIRKWTGRPYIEHPRRVANILCDANEREGGGTHGYLPAEIAAALLHDVIEDCGVTYEQLAEDFGPYIAQIVRALSNPPKSDRKSVNRQQRKQEDRDRLAGENWLIQSIKLADRIDNLQDMEDCCGDKGFLVLYRQESRLLLDSLTKADPRLRERLGDLLKRASE